MRLLPLLMAITTLAAGTESAHPKRKRLPDYLAFLDPKNQPYSYIKNGGGGMDHNSRVNLIGRRSARMRRVKMVH